MQVIRAINNNAAVCVDGKGHELIALGAGIGFGKLPHEVSLSQVDRTFYGVDEKYLGLIQELPPRTLEFAAQMADMARNAVSYELSPNLPVTLADHIAFAIKRAQEHMVVQMPLAFDVQQSYPTEYRLGELAVAGINRTFDVRLPRSEAVGIALSIVNSATSASITGVRGQHKLDSTLEQATRIVEHDLGITVDRDTFDYARFATHLRYLLDRVSQGKPIETSNAELYPMLVDQYPETSACANDVADMIGRRMGAQLTEEERAYLILHVTRVRDRAREG